LAVGIGSASIILALRSTFENFSGGVLLKLQDKFRVGDYIAVRSAGGYEGTVIDINYLNTYIRRSDDSVVTIPNNIFVSGELVNWSRSSYKKFKTTTTVPVALVTSLPTIIENIRKGLTQMKQVESKERDLNIAAVDFDGGKITINIDIYFNVAKNLDISASQTEAIGIIAKAAQIDMDSDSDSNAI
jgi:MscS family membrane protein